MTITKELTKTETSSEITRNLRDKIMSVENRISQLPGVKYGDECCPLHHSFTDDCYIREILMPAGMLISSKIHKTQHPYFVMVGDVSVLTEDGVVRIKAPYTGITEIGTKRILFTHEDTIWITVHVTKEKDLEKIEEEIIASSFEELPMTPELKILETKP